MEREDYFFGETREKGRKKVYALVIYDIVNNKRRTKFAKIMQGYGNRIQKSGFEISVSESKFNELLDIIPNYCDRLEDSIRVYRIEGRHLVHKWGVDPSVEQDDVIIL